MNNTDRLRNKTLRKINAWCYQRASHLSVIGHDNAAQALTEEHMESLRNINFKNILWVENQQTQHPCRCDELRRT